MNNVEIINNSSLTLSCRPDVQVIGKYPCNLKVPDPDDNNHMIWNSLPSEIAYDVALNSGIFFL